MRTALAAELPRLLRALLTVRTRTRTRTRTQTQTPPTPPTPTPTLTLTLTPTLTLTLTLPLPPGQVSTRIESHLSPATLPAEGRRAHP